MKRRPLFCILFSLSVFSSRLAADQIHVLKKNETLFSVARQYNYSVEELLKINGIVDPRSLPVGTTIRIPSLHRVDRGETLYGIAREYGINLQDLMKLNSIGEGYVLKAGDLIKVPAREPKEEAAAASTASERKEPEGEEEKRESTGGAAESPDPEYWPLAGDKIRVDGKLKGVQIRGKRGDPVRSISSGRVIWAGPYRGFGKVILIESPNRYVYVYGGIESINVNVGDQTQPGMVISSLGVNPHSQESELFFTVFRNGKPVDPENAPRL